MTHPPALHAHIYTSISEIPQAEWDSLLGQYPHPFLRWHFLNGLEASGCVSETHGWAPRHIRVMDADNVTYACAPLYAKSHSQGEYVFDHGWADALYQAGGDYYPKLQCAVPFTPVTGPRLIGSEPGYKSALLKAMQSACEQWDYSSLHMTFLQPEDKVYAQTQGLLIRHDRQFHFHNPGYKSFDDFLQTLTSRKRKTIRKERQIAQAGLHIQRFTGSELRTHHWDFFYQCYQDTGVRKWGRPYLNREFFTYLHTHMREDMVLIIAYEHTQPIASSLHVLSHDCLYGRYWGCLIQRPCLHFELCYYQAIDIVIERQLSRAEAGAQGEHKLARGYQPQTTFSAHHLRHSGLRAAVADYLTYEQHALNQEKQTLTQYMPYKGTHTEGNTE